MSRGKRTSLLGGLLGKKDKEHKGESEAVKEEPEHKTEEPAATAPHLDESRSTRKVRDLTTTNKAPVPTTAPVDANDVVKPAEESTAEPAAAAAAPVEEAPKAEETAVPAVAAEKPKPTKRASIFGTFVEKLKSPTTEKKEADAGLAATPVKETETAAEPTEEAAAAPSANEAAAAELNKDETKPAVATSTPSKEKEHFSFGKLFGSKDRAKSPAAQDKVPEAKTDAAPQIEDKAAEAPPAAAAAAADVPEATPAVEAKAETEEPKQDKRKSFFGNLGRSLSKAAGNKNQGNKEKKEAAAAPAPAPVVEEEAAPAAAPVAEEAKEEMPVPAAAVADVPAENSVGDASKSANPTVATTA